MNSIYENFKSSRRLYWYYLFAYGTPAIVITIMCTLAINTNSIITQRIDNYQYLLFIGPIIALSIGSAVFLLFAYLLSRNHTITTTTIKCFEDIRLGCSRNLIHWIIGLLFLHCFVWSFALIYISNKSILFAILFALFNILLAVYVCTFCLQKIDNIQHSCVFRHLPLSFCQQSDLSSTVPSTKNSTTSDVYSTRPVVTPVASTQVNGIVGIVGSPIGHHSLSSPTATTSPVSMSPCLSVPSQQQMPIVGYPSFCRSGIASQSIVYRFAS